MTREEAINDAVLKVCKRLKCEVLIERTPDQIRPYIQVYNCPKCGHLVVLTAINVQTGELDHASQPCCPCGHNFEDAPPPGHN